MGDFMDRFTSSKKHCYYSSTYHIVTVEKRQDTRNNVLEIEHADEPLSCPIVYWGTQEAHICQVLAGVIGISLSIDDKGVLPSYL